MRGVRCGVVSGEVFGVVGVSGGDDVGVVRGGECVCDV